MKSIKYDYSHLRGKIREKNFTQEELSNAASIGVVTLNHSLLHGRPFRQDEMENILSVLGEPLSMIDYYFFVHKL